MMPLIGNFFGAILDESETLWETPDTDCREAVHISSRCTDLARASLSNSGKKW